MKNIKYAIEGILFAAGEPVKASKLAVVLDCAVDDIRAAVKDLKEEYDRDERGLNIIEILDGYQICSRPEYYTYIQEILGEQRNQPLSNAAMEALAIIAYKQPITRGQIERIRGVNSDGCVNRLYERGLIEEAGRLDAPGRPILFPLFCSSSDVFSSGGVFFSSLGNIFSDRNAYLKMISCSSILTRIRIRIGISSNSARSDKIISKI